MPSVRACAGSKYNLHTFNISVAAVGNRGSGVVTDITAGGWGGEGAYTQDYTVLIRLVLTKLFPKRFWCGDDHRRIGKRGGLDPKLHSSH